MHQSLFPWRWDDQADLVTCSGLVVAGQAKRIKSLFFSTTKISQFISTTKISQFTTKGIDGWIGLRFLVFRFF